LFRLNRLQARFEALPKRQPDARNRYNRRVTPTEPYSSQKRNIDVWLC
jgi:hypothetical protein